jgi:hypothetical protein
MANVFEILKSATYCPFAKGAVVEFGPEWCRERTWCENIEEHAKALSDFADTGELRKQHGFAAEVVIGPDALDLEGVRQGFKRYLFSLAKHDEDCSRCLQQDKLSEAWQFRYSGVRFFLNVFAPCYDAPHSKFIKTSESFWVFYQPEYSFDLCNIDRTKLRTKDRIRAVFAQHGMAYSGALIDQRIEALLYMFPQNGEDEPVRWWL